MKAAKVPDQELTGSKSADAAVQPDEISVLLAASLAQASFFWRGLLRRFESVPETPPSQDEIFRSPVSASVSKTGLFVNVFRTELLVGVFKTRRFEKLRLRRS